MIYVIEKLWYDGLENHHSYGYEVIGYLPTEEQAKDFCNKGGVATGEQHYAFAYVGPMSNYRYKEISHL